MRVRLWRWSKAQQGWWGGARTSAVSTRPVAAKATLMYVPREPSWYGAQDAPPGSSSLPEVPSPKRYNVPRG